MSGLLLIWNSDGEPVSKPLFGRLLDGLSHRGPDGRSAVMEGSAALGHQHFWTTPEDFGEIQPLVDSQAGFILALDGRIDNREELFAALKPPQPDRTCSDAELMMNAFRIWDSDCFERILGSWAAIIVDSRNNRVVCSRDPLGNRPLYYRWKRGRLLAASEAAALLEHPDVSRTFNLNSIARFFALQAPGSGETFYADISELPPGHCLTAQGEKLSIRSFWNLEESSRPSCRRDEDYVENFRELLAASVKSRLRSVGGTASLMSGGLDSTSVTALAAAHLRSRNQAPLWSISWIFRELREADESPYMAAAVVHCGLRPVSIAGDSEWPLRDLSGWCSDRNAPWDGLYRRLQQRAYEAARERGARTLLTGEFGDELYAGDAFWLKDLFLDGRLATAARSLVAGFRLASPASLPPRLRLRNALSLLIRGQAAPMASPPWLTAAARQRCGNFPASLSRAHRLTHPLCAQACALETSHASRAQVEVRRPYRDRRLVEFMQAVPSHLLYRNGWTKYLLRRAMHEMLPESVRLRRWRSTLMPLASKGLVEKEARNVSALLDRNPSNWREFVHADFLKKTFPQRLLAGLDGAEAVVAWQCLCLEIWTNPNLGRATTARIDSRLGAGTPISEKWMV